MRKVIESMKRGEQSKIEVKHNFIPEEDKELESLLGADYNKELPVIIHLDMEKIIKIEDWFKDESTIVRTIRKGKGRNPFVDS